MRTVFLTCLVCLLIIFSLAHAGPVGWRTDGTGKYPAAAPPMKWSADANIVWKTPMPSWSNATPIIVGNKLFVCSEPTTLVCVNLADGKIFWTRTNTYFDMLDAAGAAKAKSDNTKAEAISRKIAPLDLSRRRARRQLGKSPKDAELKEKIQNLNKQIRALKAEMKPFTKYRMPKAHKTNGYSSSTPVSDGKHVYVLFGTGVAACYDLAGNRKWIKLIEKPTQGYGHSASPLLVGDKLLVHIIGLFALDAKSGEILWQAKARQCWGSLVHAKIGRTDVVINSSGSVIRISDGEVLTNRLPGLKYNTPIIDSDKAYFIQTKSEVFKLPKDASEKISRRPLWRATLKKDRYYASPVLHQGLVYAVTQGSIFSVIDSKDGSVVYTKNLRLGGKPYPSITLAGKYLYVSSDNGRTVVLKPGREYEEVARNRLETFRSSPVFRGKRLYIRGYKNLWCIGKE